MFSSHSVMKFICTVAGLCWNSQKYVIGREKEDKVNGDCNNSLSHMLDKLKGWPHTFIEQFINIFLILRFPHEYEKVSINQQFLWSLEGWVCVKSIFQSFHLFSSQFFPSFSMNRHNMRSERISSLVCSKGRFDKKQSSYARKEKKNSLFTWRFLFSFEDYFLLGIFLKNF